MTNDSMMTYKIEARRYVLTESAALALNINLRTMLNTTGVPQVHELADQVLDRISRTVYNFIFLHGDREQKLAELESRDAYYRPFLREAMEEQLLYFIANGDLSLTAHVNVANGMQLDRTGKRNAMYAPMMQDVLAQTDILYVGCRR